MACSTYIHNDPTGGSKYVSGTTCTGAVVNYTLTFGQSVCMDDYLPLTLENGLTNLGECIGVTPTPTPSPVTYCITSGKTFNSVDYYCGFNGVTYQNVYGNITLSVPGSQHPDYSITLTNGVDFSIVSIPNGQTFTEYVYPQVIYSTGNGVCDMQNFNDWYIYTANTSICIPPTPTPTSTPPATPTNTPTKTVTPTPSITPYAVCPQQMLLSNNTTLPELDGTYNRIYSYTGGTFSYGYVDLIGSYYYLIPGSYSGNNYPVFVSTNTTPPFNPVTLAYNAVVGAWSIFEGNMSVGNSGTDLGSPFTSSTISISGIVYPSSGQKYDYYSPGTNLLYLAYPSSCPTPTPTASSTSTPTPTPTSLPTYYYKVQLYDCNTCTTIGGTSLAISNTLLTINDYYAFQSIPNRKYLILQLETPGSYSVDFRNPGSVSSNSDCALLTCF